MHLLDTCCFARTTPSLGNPDGRAGVTRSWILALLCLATLCDVSGGDFPEGCLVKNWTTSDGLPENSVRAIVETRDGYLWVGTANGLARFDGVRFKTFNTVNTPLLFSADILGLREDHSGALWINTRRGVLRFFEGRFQTMTLRPGEQPAIFNSFAEDPQGQLWMFGPEGLAHWTGEEIEVVPTPTPGPQSIASLSTRRQGGLWIAATNGLWWYDSGEATKVEADPPPQLITTGVDGRLWGLVDGRRLYTLEDDVWTQAADLGNDRFTTVYAATNGDVWIGASSRNLVFRLHAGQLSEVGAPEGLEGNRATCFMEDRDGSLWLGMDGGGLYRLRARRLQLFTRHEGLQNSSLTSVCEDADGSVFASVVGGGLRRLVNGRFEPLVITANGALYESPTALLPAHAGGIWAGTLEGSLPRIQNECIVERIGSEYGTRALFTDRNGSLWRGTPTAGIEYFSGTNLTRFSTREGLSCDNVYCFSQDPAGAIWAGTEEGLNRIENGRITRFTTANGLGHNFISSLCVDSKGLLWVGTLGGGLSGWNGSRFITLSLPEGLPDDEVVQLTEDDDQQLWIGTRRGLMRVSLKDLHQCIAGKHQTITGMLVGRNEGLERPDCWTEYQPSCIKARDGRLWLCSGSGLLVLDPKRFAEPAPAPIVHVEEVSVDGLIQSYDRRPKAEIKIPAGKQRIEIRYTGLSLSGPELVRFRHQLQGYDRDWVEAGHNRIASYSHVKPGHYEFLVQALNNDGVWSHTSDRLAMVFEPAFWQSTWFRALLLLLFLGLGPALYFWRVRQLQRRHAVQEAFSRQLLESQEQERKRIAAELHDSLGQNLLVIKNRAAFALTQLDRPDKLAAHVTEVSAMASASIREVHDIAQNLRPYQLDELGLAKSIASMVRSLAHSSSIQFECEFDDIDGALPPEFEINLYRIVQECLNNVLKHAHAKTVTTVLRRGVDAIHVVVVDDGRGFEPETTPLSAPSGFGLINIVERARMMGGDATFKSRSGAGTRVQIRVPLS